MIAVPTYFKILCNFCGSEEVSCPDWNARLRLIDKSIRLTIKNVNPKNNSPIHTKNILEPKCEPAPDWETPNSNIRVPRPSIITLSGNKNLYSDIFFI